jgi:hypothetical protein
MPAETYFNGRYSLTNSSKDFSFATSIGSTFILPFDVVGISAR